MRSLFLLDDDLLDVLLGWGGESALLVRLSRLHFNVGAVELGNFLASKHDVFDFCLLSLQELTSVHVQHLLGDDGDEPALILLQLGEALVALTG